MNTILRTRIQALTISLVLTLLAATTLADESDTRIIAVSGEILRVMPDKGLVKIDHEPVEALSWPAMKMNFRVAEKVSLAELAAGDAVDFLLEVAPDNSYRIVEIEKQ